MGGRIFNIKYWWTRKKSEYTQFCHSRENGNPVFSSG